jgi:hypothetical protein
VLTTIAAMLFRVGREFPLQTLILVSILAMSAIFIALYVAELVLLHWMVDLFDWITLPRRHAKNDPLEYDQVGEIIIVKLGSHIVTLKQCHAVQKQLKHLIDEHHCDFILDFSGIARLSRSFRGVMVRLRTAARREAERLGKSYQPILSPPGELFCVFDDRESAVEEMESRDGHGWVVLCGVPPGIRAVSDVT